MFAPAWHYVGPRSRFDRESVTPVDVTGTPVVVAVDEHDELRAFVNVCRHRGAIVCEAASGTLRCPYHGWTYGLDGALRTAPRSSREVGFDPSDHGLHVLETDTWGPFVFVATDPAAGSLVDALGDLPRLVAEVVDVDALVHLTRTDTDLAANWKVCVENFLECYHCRIAHPGFSKVIDTGPDDYRLETAPTFSTQYGPVREGWTGPFDPSGPVGRSQFHLVFPSTTINIMPGHPNLSIGPVIPTSSTTTHRFLDYYVGPEVDETWLRDMMAFDGQVGDEDRDLVESVQRGMAARPHDHGTLFLDSERLIAHFADWVRARVA